MRLSRQVRYNTKQSQGKLQMSYQTIRWVGPPAPATGRLVSDVQNHWILVQGIQANTPIWSPQEATPTTLVVAKPGSWVTAPHPSTVLNVAYKEFDQLQFFANSLGVQAVYTHYSSDYLFNFFAKDCTGWVQIDMLEYRRDYNIAVGGTTDFNLPETSVGMTHCAQGANTQYRDNPFLFKRTRLARKYFNTSAASTAGHYLGTNPNFSIRLRIKNPKHKKLVRLRAATGVTGGLPPITDGDTISKNVQRWLCVSTTLEDAQSSANNNVSYDVYRTNYWRDATGSVS